MAAMIVESGRSKWRKAAPPYFQMDGPRSGPSICPRRKEIVGPTADLVVGMVAAAGRATKEPGVAAAAGRATKEPGVAAAEPDLVVGMEPRVVAAEADLVVGMEPGEEPRVAAAKAAMEGER